MTRLRDIYTGGPYVFVCVDCGRIFGCASDTAPVPVFCDSCAGKERNRGKCPKTFPPDTWVKRACCGC